MVTENLLATYSLLSVINDQKDGKKGKQLIQLFVPIVKQSINWLLYNNGFKELRGKDYTEIRDGIKKFFDLEMPINVIGTIMDIIYHEDNNQLFIVNNDHSYIIRQGFAISLEEEFQEQKNRIARLENHYQKYCKRVGVAADFLELISFLQDQQNRIFEHKETIIGQQNDHVSRYVQECIRRRDEIYEIICGVYLGGIISLYFQFRINEKVVDTELLWDTNFYISLCNLNTPEAYQTCHQLLDITTAMGFRHIILERTIEQIRILLTNKARDFDSKDYLSLWDEADILAACRRENLSRSDLLLIKDNLKDDLAHKGVTIVYDANIRGLIESAEKSDELKQLIKIRHNKESAMNDTIAKMYVENKRKNKQIAEFNDVNCWFLNNSFSVNSNERDVPVWQRSSISAPDLLLLLWLANPSLMGRDQKKMLAMSSLSANVFKFRSERMPSSQTINAIQEKVAKLQVTNQVSPAAVAKLCIRMSEGCIQENEAQQLLLISTDELVSYMEKLKDTDNAYMQVSEENDDLREANGDLRQSLLIEKVETELYKGRLFAVLFGIISIVGYIVYLVFINGNYINNQRLSIAIQLVWCIISFLVGIFTDKVKLGIKSFFCPQRVRNEMMKSILQNEY